MISHHAPTDSNELASWLRAEFVVARVTMDAPGELGVLAPEVGRQLQNVTPPISGEKASFVAAVAIDDVLRARFAHHRHSRWPDTPGVLEQNPQTFEEYAGMGQLSMAKMKSPLVAE